MADVRLAWLATHPIQYQAPLLRAVAATPGVDLTALFFSDMSVRGYVDREFGCTVEWDVPLLDGYRHEFLTRTGEREPGISFLRPRISGLVERLTRDHFDAVLVQGWNHYGYPLGAWLARRAGLKVLMRCEATRHVTESTGLKGLARRAFVGLMLGQVDRFLAIGTRNREFYLSWGIPPERIGDMPYAVDNDFFHGRDAAVDRKALRASLGFAPDRPVILYASKLTARKRADDLLEAYRRLSLGGLEPNPYLVYAGDGELRPALEQRVAKLGWRSVRFLGFKNQGELLGYYALADVFVLPSFNETWGLVVNEAMNAGCAIVVSDQVGSGVDLVEDGVNGAKFRAGDVAGLTRALDRTLQNDAYLDMGRKSLERIGRWGLTEDVVGLCEALSRLGLPVTSDHSQSA